jgi:hypothetical protein
MQEEDFMFDKDSKKSATAFARYLRLSTVRGQVLLGRITIDEGKELLCGNLTPDDPTTFYNDSDLLEEDEDSIIDAVWPNFNLED